MAAITIRNLSPETHRGIKARAERHGRSTEAEVRAILDEAIHPPQSVRLGSLLADIGREVGGLELERDRSTTEPVDLS